MSILVIERLPVIERPGYDCWKDNANCPHCKRKPGDHGISGGVSSFGVRTTYQGRLYAVELEVLCPNYPPTVDMSAWSERNKQTRGGALVLHGQAREGGEECLYLGVPCDSSTIGFLAGDMLWKAHGDDSGGPNQSDAFWKALSAHLEEAVAGLDQPS